MATYADLSLTTRLFLKAYPFHRYTIDPLPCAPVRVPLAQARFALVTTAGLRTSTQSDFDFTNGDAITLEAWVKLDDLRPGENLYIIGKGRTRAEVFAADNQNWALRVREQRGKACVSFLFATVPVSGVAKR